MKSDSEVKIRDSLQAWAAQVIIEPPPAWAMPGGRAAEPRKRRPMRLALAGAGSLAVAVAVVAALVYAPPGQTLKVSGSASSGLGAGGSIPTPFTDPPKILLGDPNWRVVYFTYGPPTDGTGIGYTEYQFKSQTGGYLQISFYPPGTRTLSASQYPSEIQNPAPSRGNSAGGYTTVRGVQGLVTNEGSPRWRLDWDEAGRQWEADGSPFATPQALATFLANVRQAADAEWQSQMPAGLLGAIARHPTTDVTWEEGKPLACYPPNYQGGSPPPAC